MEVYAHLRILVSLILGLGITRILSGLARLVQAPSWRPATAAHVIWSVVVLLNSVHFWWWEFALRDIKVWHFGSYLVVLLYAFMMFLLASLLFPDVSHDHDGSDQYFVARRRWFFAIFALSFVIDVLDTSMKGGAYAESLGALYWIRMFVAVTICMIAGRAKRARILSALGLIWLACDIFWISWRYDVLG